jgi:transposase
MQTGPIRSADKLHKPWDVPREGLNTKIHALASARSQPIVIVLSNGNEADISLANDLTECLLEDSTLIGDKAYDSSSLRQTTATKGVRTCIPGRTNRTTAVPFSAKLYRRRHRVENFFQRIKRYRRVATRYDKLGETFLGFVCLAILLTLRLT